MYKKISSPLLAASLSALLTFPHLIHANTLEDDYRSAVSDAAFAGKDEIVSDLNAANRENQHLVWNEDGTKLLVITWKAKGAYENFIKPYTATSDKEDYVVWVTLAPQVQIFCRNFMASGSRSKDDLDLRLKQYLGLNHNWNYDVFVELWVSPEDLFRPCVDPEPTDTSCNLEFGKEAPAVKNIKDYKEFYKNLYFKSFRASEGVPWTGIGYTYDWAGQGSEVGASEFILAPNAPYEIKAATPTMDYCSQAVQ